MPRPVRPRWGRICAAATAVVVTLVALLGAVGLVPVAGASAAPTPSATASLASDKTPSSPSSDPEALLSHQPGHPATSADAAVPAATGAGKRVVFDMSDQRVWLVDADGTAERTYLVSASLTDNLHPGTYAVYSTSRWATGVDDSGVMQYFVRFTHGAHAAIGFHSIPTKNGKALETRAQLGTPQSHGCIRQWLPDAQALWAFAPVGTKVVVTA